MSSLQKVGSPSEVKPSRWPHRIAVLLATLVFPLIWLGGMVTTTDAGMAVPDWPGTYGYNMFLYPVETWLFGPFDLLVEHGHRLLASLSGLIAIGLVIVTFRSEPRRWVGWMSVALLLLIILQGALGGARVLFDARLIAQIHGCVGPAFFCSVVAFCVVTSNWWKQPVDDRLMANGAGGGWIAWTALFLLAASFLQLTLGAWIRHVDIQAPAAVFRGLVISHVSLAILIVLGAIGQWLFSRRKSLKNAGIRGSVNAISILVLLQFSLGLGTWIVKYGWPIWFAEFPWSSSFVIGEKTLMQSNLVTAHVAVGSLILAFGTVHALRCFRWNAWANQQESEHSRSEAVAESTIEKPLERPLAGVS